MNESDLRTLLSNAHRQIAIWQCIALAVAIAFGGALAVVEYDHHIEGGQESK